MAGGASGLISKVFVSSLMQGGATEAASRFMWRKWTARTLKKVKFLSLLHKAEERVTREAVANRRTSMTGQYTEGSQQSLGDLPPWHPTSSSLCCVAVPSTLRNPYLFMKYVSVPYCDSYT